MKTRSIAVVLTAAALTAGCTGVRTVAPVGGISYYNGAFEYATRDGSIDTVVLGSPFAANESIADVTTSYMKGANEGREVTFKPVSWAASKGKFRMVVLFNGVQPYTPEELCQNGAEFASRPHADDVTVNAVFCDDDRLLSFADGYADSLQGPDDPKFRKLVRTVTRDAIPQVDLDLLLEDAPQNQ